MKWCSVVVVVVLVIGIGTLSCSNVVAGEGGNCPPPKFWKNCRIIIFLLEILVDKCKTSILGKFRGKIKLFFNSQRRWSPVQMPVSAIHRSVSLHVRCDGLQVVRTGNACRCASCCTGCDALHAEAAAVEVCSLQWPSGTRSPPAFVWRTSNSLTQAVAVMTERINYTGRHVSVWHVFLWLIGTVRAEPETVISRAWVQSPDPAE